MEISVVCPDNFTTRALFDDPRWGGGVGYTVLWMKKKQQALAPHFGTLITSHTMKDADGIRFLGSGKRPVV